MSKFRPFLTDENAPKGFIDKKPEVKLLINQAIDIIKSFGIPLNDSPRRTERMAMAFLAVAGIFKIENWNECRGGSQPFALKTREIIIAVNRYFGEKISSGSYDDIRRKDLKLLVLDGLVVASKPNSARNDSTRGYSIYAAHAKIIKMYGTRRWSAALNKFMRDRKKLSENLQCVRNLETVPVVLPSGLQIELSLGKHNELQKAIIEQFLPHFGHGTEVFYLGDTSKKLLYVNEKKLKELNFFELSHGELPDIIAYNKEKNWLYLIEAVHTSGPFSPERRLELERLTETCTARLIYITAFPDKATFRKFITEIAWETEVWIADDPDHLIHFDGDKYLSPYEETH